MLGPTYTPVSLLKKIFKVGEHSLSREEISRRLYAYVKDDAQRVEACIDQALAEPMSPFRETFSRAIIERKHGVSELSHHVHRFLKEAHAPLSEDKILRKLRGQNLISWTFPFKKLGLQEDMRFVRILNDDRWLLTDWDIANDNVYSYMISEGKRALSMREVSKLIQRSLTHLGEKAIFIPELDKRFLVENEMIYMNESFLTQMEVATTMNTELANVNTASTVVDEVVTDLMEACIKLEKRSEQMKGEVISYFTANDLTAISALMKEKEKHERVLSKLKELVDDLSQE